MTGASTLGDAINERRLSLHYSIGQLATVVDVTASEVRAWENGERVPDSAEIAKLAGALKVKKSELAKLVPEPDPEPEPSDVPEATAVVAAATKPKVQAAEPPVAQVDSESEEMTEEETTEEEEATERAPEPEVAPVRSKVAAPVPDPGQAMAEAATAEVAAVAEAPTAPDVAAAEGAPGITELPTERIPVIKDAPPPPERQPAQPAVAVATAPPPRTSTPAPSTPGPATPWRQTMEMIFDRDKPWLFWIRTGLLLIGMLVLLRILAWAVPEFFSTLGEILDTIQSTTPDPEIEDPIPIGP